MTKKTVNLLLFLSVFVDWIGLSLIIPLLPFCAQQFGANALQISLLFTLYSLMQFIFTPFWGQSSDHFGRRPIILISLFGSGLSYLWFGLANSLLMVFLARIFAGIMGSSITVAQAYVADTTTPENRTTAMGMLGATVGASFTLGPAIGGILAGNDPNQLNFQFPLFCAAGLSFFSFILALFLLPESLPKNKRQIGKNSRQKFNWQEVFKILKRPRIMWLFPLYFIMNFATCGTQAIVVIQLEKTFNWGPQPVGYVLMFCGVVAVFVQAGGIRKLINIFPNQISLLMFGFLAQVLGLIAVPFSLKVPFLLFSLALWTMGEAVSRTMLNGILSKSTSAKKQGLTLGIAQSISSLGRILGPIWAGYIYFVINGSWSFWTAALFNFLAVIIILLVLKKQEVLKFKNLLS